LTKQPDPSDDPEIEIITPEMIEAGLAELYCHDISLPVEEEMKLAVKRVFLVMLSLRAK
jgi:hypothetical protein